MIDYIQRFIIILGVYKIIVNRVITIHQIGANPLWAVIYPMSFIIYNVTFPTHFTRSAESVNFRPTLTPDSGVGI